MNEIEVFARKHMTTKSKLEFKCANPGCNTIVRKDVDTYLFQMDFLGINPNFCVICRKVEADQIEKIRRGNGRKEYVI